MKTWNYIANSLFTQTNKCWTLNLLKPEVNLKIIKSPVPTQHIRFCTSVTKTKKWILVKEIMAFLSQSHKKNHKYSMPLTVLQSHVSQRIWNQKPFKKSHQFCKPLPKIISTCRSLRHNLCCQSQLEHSHRRNRAT